ncbi:MAG: sigma-54-dependent Fis family transcriptional regulator, partial [Acidobacteriaceae bacterium]|nr:sigma-54-dependent Fis family transcriptional regulator [Acidobacteriaceae bacterium]
NSGPWISKADLPSAIVNRSLERTLTLGSHGAAEVVSPQLGEGTTVLPLAEVERRAILRAIEITRGDRTIAAALLGIGRTTLYRKLKEYGL